MEDPVSFASLRRRAIALAQGCSGGIWTDYNLHDPGVTLLEAIAYALTELAYRADFPVADLLTGADGRLDLARLGLGPPEAVLPARPVTGRDLALFLSGCDEAVERVLVQPVPGAPGLWDAHVVPAAAADPAAAVAAVRRAFHANRSLCEDLRTLALAQAVPCRLEARIDVHRRHPPERIAARVYDRCRRLMRDRGATRVRPAATRADAFDDPAALYGQAADPAGGAPALDLFFAELAALEEVEDVISLGFRRLDDPAQDAFAPLGPGQYRTLVLPARTEEVGLVLVSRDLELPFDLAGMTSELARLGADHAAALHGTLAPADWAPVADGRRRRSDHVPLGRGLPAAYRTAVGEAAGDRFRGYIAILDAALAGASADVGRLGELFSPALSPASYAAPAAGSGVEPEGAAAIAAAVAEHDPWRDRKGRVLDRLLALQGEEFSQNSLRHTDPYRGPAARDDAILANRARLIGEMAALARARAGAPDLLASAPFGASGLGRKLAIVLELGDGAAPPIGEALARAGLRLVPGVGPAGDWRRERAELRAGPDPFDTLVPRLDLPAPEDPAALVAGTAFLAGGALGLDVLRRGVNPDRYLLSPEPEGGWSLMLETGAGDTLLAVGRFPDRPAAIAHANRLRAFLVALNRRAERVHLVEDVLLRDAGGGYAPMAATFVFAGWTARTRSTAFRQLAEETVALLCPAHVGHRVVWLDHAAMAAFEALQGAWRSAWRDAGPGRPETMRRAGALRESVAGAAGG